MSVSCTKETVKKTGTVWKQMRQQNPNGDLTTVAKTEMLTGRETVGKRR